MEPNNTTNTILIIDDDRDMCVILKRFLAKKGFKALDANSGKTAIEILQSTKPDLILCDFRLDDMDGTDILKRVKEIYSDVPVIMITGYSNIKTAVEVIKLGAIDYVTKPLLPDEILTTINRALQKRSGQSEQEPEEQGNTERPVLKKETYIFGKSHEFRNILTQIDLVAPTNYSVIIYGETGSGKEVIAQEIHKRSARANEPFIAIDCGALSKELASSELFGHEKGSFTSAINKKIGSFELANHGTIFLDEIGNLPYDVQVSLLRVIQERKLRRVGGGKDIDLDVRLIVASNEKLWDSTRVGKFREDLYHRLNEFHVHVPPLRERKNDIMTFATHFLVSANEELGKQVKGFSPEVETIFKNYIWHGNLRELRNVVKRATLLTDAEYIDVGAIPFEVTNFTKLQFEGNDDPSEEPVETADAKGNSPLRSVVREVGLKAAGLDAEYEMILETLKRVNFNKSKAARLLKIDRKTIYNKIKQYRDLDNVEFREGR